MISVCLASYNGEKYIAEQIQSILDQLGPGDEVIVSDDGSSDSTVPLVEAFRDKRIRLVSNTKKKGVTGNFESALEQAIGEYIFLSDQDDVWLPNRISNCLPLLKTYDLVVCDALVVNASLEEMRHSAFSLRNTGAGFLKNFYQIKYLGCCMAFRRGILEDVLPIPSNHLLITHDSWITLVCELLYKTSLVEDRLIMYRRHGSNLSDGGFRSGNSLFKKTRIRFYALRHLIFVLVRKLAAL